MSLDNIEFVLDMVHHNPGEPPFQSSFNDPQKLKEYNYSGQVFKHINCAATFQKAGVDIWQNNTPECQWLEEFTSQREREINLAKTAGLDVFYHIDLFLLPQKLVELYKDDICDENGCISLKKAKTLEIHEIMFEEIIERYPQIDGFIIRVGETYLFDTPFHIGNGAIKYDSEFPFDNEKVMFVKLITFLRDLICDRYGKYLIFRTWDCFGDRFHSSLDYYLDVTNNIVTHEKLLFSIKHTNVDFWRYAELNPCLTKGLHGQIIEVQCQREYEGKGAYPCYVMDGVINGFNETAHKRGMKDIVYHSLIKGVYGWSRGGGWYGPYVSNEFWPDLNAYVISNYFNATQLSEKKIFENYCYEELGLGFTGMTNFRKMCELASKAVLKGRYCSAYDKGMKQSCIPTGNWMRDDFLGGYNQLRGVFEYLFKHNKLDDAVEEKRDAMVLWNEIKQISELVVMPDADNDAFLRVSVEYGRLLFSIVYHGWNIMIQGYLWNELGDCNKKELSYSIEAYDRFWQEYIDLKVKNDCCATLYKDCGFGPLWQVKKSPGLGDAVDQCRTIISSY